MPTKKQEKNAVLQELIQPEALWRREGAVLRLEASLPCLPGCRRFSAYYARLYRALGRFCRDILLPRLPEAAAPVTMCLGHTAHRAAPDLLQVTCTLSCAGSALWRGAALWDTKIGFPLPLRSFFPGVRLLRARLSRQLLAEMDRRTGRGEAVYYADAARRVRRNLDMERYQLTPSGILLFFPLDCLGPLSEGLVEFLLPWDALGPDKPRKPACVSETDVL